MWMPVESQANKYEQHEKWIGNEKDEKSATFD